MNCPSCGKNLSAPDTAAGKKAKCPACGQIMVVPEVVHDAEEFGSPPPQPSTPYSPQPPAGSTENWLNDVQGAAAPTAPGPGGEARRPCRECGEMILAGAARCRFCGAVFDSRLRGSAMHGGQSYQGFAITSMVLGIVGVFTFCVGILFGIIAVIFGGVALNGMARSRNNEGKGMAIAGLVLGIIECAGWGLWYLFFMAAIGSLPHHH